MTRAWFSGDLETVATFWRVVRGDGGALGFTTHDRDLWFDGVLHRAAPGMVPSAIRRSADLEPDSVEARGAIAHDAIAAQDLAMGRFDGAQVRIGVVDWDSGEREVLYAGSIGAIAREDGTFPAELVSRKAELLRDPVPRTSPACRAVFCGPGCNLNPARFTREVTLAALDADANAVSFAEAPDPADHAGGTLAWRGARQAGVSVGVRGGPGVGGALVGFPPATPAGTRALLREGCDHTLDTCATRFANAVNFRGEPFLPGNDLLTRYPAPVT